MPSDDLLLHGLSHTTIGAGAFHFRVRNGIGWDHTAMVTGQGGEAALERQLAWGGKVANEANVVDVSSRPRPLEVIWSSHTDH